MSLRKKRRQCIPIFLRYQQLMGRQCVDYRDGTNGYQPRSLVNKNGYHPAHFGWRSWTPSFGQNGTQRIPSVSTRLPARHALFGRDLEINGYDQAMTMGARPHLAFTGRQASECPECRRPRRSGGRSSLRISTSQAAETPRPCASSMVILLALAVSAFLAFRPDTCLAITGAAGTIGSCFAGAQLAR